MILQSCGEIVPIQRICPADLNSANLTVLHTFRAAGWRNVVEEPVGPVEATWEENTRIRKRGQGREKEGKGSEQKQQRPADDTFWVLLTLNGASYGGGIYNKTVSSSSGCVL